LYTILGVDDLQISCYYRVTMPNPRPNTSGLTPFSKTYQPKKHGRKPSHLKKYLKENNVGTTDIRRILGGIIADCKTIDDLKDKLKDPNTPPIVSIPIKCLLHDYAFNKMDTYKFLCEYGYGAPKQEIKHTGAVPVEEMSRDERLARIEALLAKRKDEATDGTEK
jgi:hypothetical protein